MPYRMRPWDWGTVECDTLEELNALLRASREPDPEPADPLQAAWIALHDAIGWAQQPGEGGRAAMRLGPHG